MLERWAKQRTLKLWIPCQCVPVFPTPLCYRFFRAVLPSGPFVNMDMLSQLFPRTSWLTGTTSRATTPSLISPLHRVAHFFPFSTSAVCFTNYFRPRGIISFSLHFFLSNRSYEPAKPPRSPPNASASYSVLGHFFIDTRPLASSSFLLCFET